MKFWRAKEKGNRVDIITNIYIRFNSLIISQGGSRKLSNFLSHNTARQAKEKKKIIEWAYERKSINIFQLAKYRLERKQEDLSFLLS